MRILISLMLILFCPYGQGDANYLSGQSFGESLNASCPVKADFMTGIQGYGADVETFTAEDLDRRKETLFNEENLEANEDLRSLHEQGVNRKAYTVHPNDPMITRAYEALTDPEKFLTEAEHDEEVITAFEEKTCEEQAQEETTHTCTHELVKASQVQKRKIYWRTHYYGRWNKREMHCPGGNENVNYYRVEGGPRKEIHRSWTDGCNDFNQHIVNEFKYHKRIISVGRSGAGESTAWVDISKAEYERAEPTLPDEWIHNCTRYTAGSSIWGCRKVNEKCLEGPTTKTRGGLSFTRPCWFKEETYQCGYVAADTCEALRGQGCTQTGVRCKVKETISGKDICRVWQKRMKCPKTKARHRRKNDERSLPVCTGGACVGRKARPNKDFLRALSKLALLKQIQDENEKGADKILSVFKGGHKTCTTSKFGYENCCKASEGWMTAVGGRCKPEEKQLAKERTNGLCVEVGKFCSKYLNLPFGKVCRQEKKSFCCFPSRLSKLIHKQGRPQIGRGWGDKEHPDCSGFTVEQLARIDFDRLDTGELFAALNAKKRVAPPAAITSRISERMSTMVDRLGNNDRGRGA